MSGVSPAWILVMISWLMFETWSHLIVMSEPSAESLALRAFSRPAWTGASMLDQIVTVLLLPPPPLPPPQAVRLTAAAVSRAVPRSVVRVNGAPHECSLRFGPCDLGVPIRSGM